MFSHLILNSMIFGMYGISCPTTSFWVANFVDVCSFMFPLFNSLWFNEATWHRKTSSMLVQIMVCCLTAPNHYLNQCGLINVVLWCSPEYAISQETIKISMLGTSEKITIVRLHPHLPGTNELILICTFNIILQVSIESVILIEAQVSYLWEGILRGCPAMFEN